MAARLDLYAVAAGGHVVGVDQAALDTDGVDRSRLPDLEGWVSASDADEQALIDLLGVIADRTTFDARTHGSGRLPAPDVADLAERLAELAGEREGLDALWCAAIADGVAAVSARGCDLAWRMRYDLAGSVDSGPEEFPTASG